jgi:4a-hydroxytetrahydrobiopterin dehydratase
VPRCTACSSFADFAEAFAFMTRVRARGAGAAPPSEMAISWNRVTFSLTTHDAGRSVTDKDRELADVITRIAAAR